MRSPLAPWLGLAALALALTVCGCAVPFLHSGGTGVKAPRAAKATKAPKGARVAKVAKAGRDGVPQKAASAPEPNAVAEVAADDAAAWYARAVRQLASDSASAAEQSLRTALEREPAYSPALALTSKLDFEAGRHADAIERLSIVTSEPQRFRDDERALLLTGLALHQDALGRTQDARATLTAAPTAQPRRTGSARAYVLLRSESPDEATAVAREALERDGKSAVNLNNSGITLLRVGDVEGARKAFLKSIERDPQLGGPYYNLAILEKFYLLDDAAGARWYAAYRERSQADPDGLAQVFRAGDSKPVAQEGAGR